MANLPKYFVIRDNFEPNDRYTREEKFRLAVELNTWLSPSLTPEQSEEHVRVVREDYAEIRACVLPIFSATDNGLASHRDDSIYRLIRGCMRHSTMARALRQNEFIDINGHITDIPELSLGDWEDLFKDKKVRAFSVRPEGGQLVAKMVYKQRNEVVPADFFSRGVLEAIVKAYPHIFNFGDGVQDVSSIPYRVLVKEVSTVYIDLSNVKVNRGLYIDGEEDTVGREIDGCIYISSLRDAIMSSGHAFTSEMSGNMSFKHNRFLTVDNYGELILSSSYYDSRESYLEISVDSYDYLDEAENLHDYYHEHSIYAYFSGEEARDEFDFVYNENLEVCVHRDQMPVEVNAEYHALVRRYGTQYRCDVGTTDFTIGFEIEKEDVDMKNEYPYQELYEETQWFKERDGSLDEDAGYELASPVYNLMSDDLEKDIEKYSSLKNLIDATYNIHNDPGDAGSCGGHINLGSRIYSPIQLFFGLKGFLPLLYSVYDLRVFNGYSEAKPTFDYLNDNHHGRNNHHTALQIKSNVIEFRIVAAVRNVKNLLWRRDLFRIMVSHINKSEQDVLRMMLNPRSLLYRHLRKVYKSDDRYMKKCNDFVRFSEKFNSVKLPPIDWGSVKFSSSKENENENSDNNEGSEG